MSGPVSLGEFEQVVLLAVLRVGEDAYTQPLLAEIRRASGRDVVRGALYTALDRLQEKGLLSSRLGEPLAERGGRPRRYFALTARGLLALRESRRSLLRLWDGLEGVLGKP
jgi:DNA-binding PadR family transcriptional regulator